MQQEASIDLLFRIINSLKDYAIFSMDQQGNIIFWNDGATNVLGYARDEIIGSNGAMFFTKEDIDHGIPEKELTTALSKGTAIDERYHVRKDGSLFWASGLVYPLFDGNGNHLGFTKIMRNYVGTRIPTAVTADEIENAELRNLVLVRELEKSEWRLNQVMASSKIGVWDLDEISGKAVISLSHARIFGYDQPGQDWGTELFLTHVIPEDRQLAADALKGGWDTGGLNVQVRIRRVDNNEVRWLQLTGEVVREEDTGRKRMMGTTTDISSQKEMDRRRDELITIVSHELKTPITSLKAYVQLLDRKVSFHNDGEAAEMISKMDTQIRRLVTLVTDLLDVSKIESGHLQLRKDEFDFADLIDEVVNEIQKTTTTHRILVQKNPHVRITGDATRTRQVITNLLTNAIKYSPQADNVIVTADHQGTEVTFSVQDFGIGIPINKQKRIFERFYRVSEDPNYSVSGIGMGLYISSEIVSRLGGRMWFDSVEHQGSTFSFSIPV